MFLMKYRHFIYMSDMGGMEKQHYPGPAEQVIPDQVPVKNSFTFFLEPRAAFLSTRQHTIKSSHRPCHISR